MQIKRQVVCFCDCCTTFQQFVPFLLYGNKRRERAQHGIGKEMRSVRDVDDNPRSLGRQLG